MPEFARLATNGAGMAFEIEPGGLDGIGFAAAVEDTAGESDYQDNCAVYHGCFLLIVVSVFVFTTDKGSSGVGFRPGLTFFAGGLHFYFLAMSVHESG